MFLIFLEVRAARVVLTVNEYKVNYFHAAPQAKSKIISLGGFLLSLPNDLEHPTAEAK